MKSRSVILSTLLVLLLLSEATFGGSATWSDAFGGNNWNDASNWNPNTVPNGPNDIATFGLASTTTLTAGAMLQVDSIIFNPGASAYFIYVAYDGVTGPTTFSFLGAGMINNSGSHQSMIARAESTIYFFNDATAGTLTSFEVDGGVSSESVGAGLQFFNNATAGSASFTIKDANYGSAGLVEFFDTSSAGNGVFSCQGGEFTGYIFGGEIAFNSSSSAGNATITAEGAQARNANGGEVQFYNTSTAASATLIANGGTSGGGGGQIVFRDTADGGNARVEVFGNAILDATQQVASKLTIGSLEGDGQVIGGSSNLTIGTNNLSTLYSGAMSLTSTLTKTGAGTLILTNPNNYTFATVVNGGFLLLNNTSGLGTGTSPVRVMSGTLGGSGIIYGPVTIGTGVGPGAALGPGKNSNTPGTLTIQKNLSLLADATYKVTLNSDRVAADKASAAGIRIRRANIAFLDLGTTALPSGTTFTIIENTAATPIAGTFSNLSDGSTVIIGNNTFQADYEGGDGNDLTLTVVP